MRLPDGTILMHAGRPYDPVKAHEYYLRTRKLKGRKRGQAQPPKVDPKAKANAAATVARLQKKIQLLEAELRKRKEEAKKAAQEAKKKPTAEEKRKAAKQSKQYRQKHKQELKTKAKQAAAKNGGGTKKASNNKGGSIEDLQKTIDGLKVRLAAAVARQRALG